MGDKKKGGKLKKFFLFAMIAAIGTAVMRMVKGRRGGGLEDSEWQELPPPASS